MSNTDHPVAVYLARRERYLTIPPYGVPTEEACPSLAYVPLGYDWAIVHDAEAGQWHRISRGTIDRIALETAPIYAELATIVHLSCLLSGYGHEIDRHSTAPALLRFACVAPPGGVSEINRLLGQIHEITKKAVREAHVWESWAPIQDPEWESAQDEARDEARQEWCDARDEEDEAEERWESVRIRDLEDEHKHDRATGRL